MPQDRVRHGRMEKEIRGRNLVNELRADYPLARPHREHHTAVLATNVAFDEKPPRSAAVKTMAQNKKDAVSAS